MATCSFNETNQDRIAVFLVTTYVGGCGILYVKLRQGDADDFATTIKWLALSQSNFTPDQVCMGYKRDDDGTVTGTLWFYQSTVYVLATFTRLYAGQRTGAYNYRASDWNFIAALSQDGVSELPDGYEYVTSSLFDLQTNDTD